MQLLGGALAMSPCRTTDTSQLFKLSPVAKNFDNLQFLTYLIVKGRSYDPVSCAFISRRSLEVFHLGRDFDHSTSWKVSQGSKLKIWLYFF